MRFVEMRGEQNDEVVAIDVECVIDVSERGDQGVGVDHRFGHAWIISAIVAGVKVVSASFASDFLTRMPAYTPCRSCRRTLLTPSHSLNTPLAPLSGGSGDLASVGQFGDFLVGRPFELVERFRRVVRIVRFDLVDRFDLLGRFASLDP